MSEKTTSEFMLEIASHYLINGCDGCPFYSVTKTCDSKPINCNWMALRNYFKAEESKEESELAEPERKKGKWIEVHGYFTPGGDPVWKCSECGKGIHVYGIEAPSYNRDYTDDHQWVACPNCGADMRGEDGKA